MGHPRNNPYTEIKMSIKAVLFDLDGTLLPLDQNQFIKEYFKGLVSALSPIGCEPEVLERSIWSGTGAMIKNNGAKTNEQAFLECFSSLCKVDMERFDRLATDYYKTKYRQLAALTRPTEKAKEAVMLARNGERQVVLATNPLFPKVAQHARIEFAGLEPSDFDLITCYDTDSYSKPNPEYYLSICKRIGVTPGECAMIGNDENEDMYAASSVGMRCFLVDDCALLSETHPWEGERGSFDDMLEFLRKL